MSEYAAQWRDHGGSVRFDGTVCFTGPGNEPGSHWYDGGGPPSDAFGVDGDYYLDDDNGDIYRKEGGTWV